MAKHLEAFEVYLIETRQVEALQDEPKAAGGGNARAMTLRTQIYPTDGHRGAD